MSSEETSIYATKEDLEELKSDLKQIIDTVNILLEFEIKKPVYVYPYGTDGARVAPAILPDKDNIKPSILGRNEDAIKPSIVRQLENSSKAFEKLQDKYRK
ncbi:Hypothetical protein TFLO_3084 [Trichococcus flocculiformis]|uniref:Uncharacterized protein n=1 Tax=Trichococcus flocculiformis TaxID=82803 RepID=A0AB38BLY9_9LACT|nr:hypothetical protein [Trichococcus flocculiformis]NCC82240.1 hypothetical protein [Clostridia bacterium]CZR05851.1 Hypothetical protein TFLO_3084 [Trichococcus flocculiformis]SFI25251.1 hypothetical protein SAMN04488507_10921 [Trichococcus flocculiformis]